MMDTKKCPHCGRLLHNDAQYCMYCMTSLQPKKDITPNIRPRPRWMILCVILCVIILLLALIIILYNHNDKAGQTPAAETHQTQEPSAGEEPSAVIDEAAVMDTTAATEAEENESTAPATTEPAQTQTQPSTEQDLTNPPTQQLCSHYYMPADCVTPMTCSYCGDTYGSVSPEGHQWKPHTAVVHHDEAGHYEEKEVYFKKTVYLCFFCGYNQEGFDSMEAVRAHTPVHAQVELYDFLLPKLDQLTETREEWATRTETQWVVDEQAYDETVLLGYICTLCGKEQGP